MFQREGVIYQTDICQWLRTSLGETWLPSPDWEQWKDETYTISLLNWRGDDPSPVTGGHMVFTDENIQLFLPEGLPGPEGAA